jgi:hypothetical protein
MNRKISLVLFFLAIFLNVTAQEADTLSKKQRKEAKRTKPAEKGDIYFLLMPTVGYNPSYGFMYGVGATVSGFLGDPGTTSISTGLVGANYTTLDQLITNFRSNIYTENNKWLFNSDWRYMDTSQPTFGLGTGPNSTKIASNGFEISEGVFSAPIDEAQQMSYKLIRVYQTVSRKIDSTLYAGIGYHLDIYTDIDDQLVNLDTTPPVITSTYAYNSIYGFNQNKSVASGISFNVSFDTRDNQNDPYKGIFMGLNCKFNQTFLGSDKNSTLLWLEARKYLDLTKDHQNMLCFWGYANLTLGGNLPYLNLPALGWDQFGRSGRGYMIGRFRGENLLYFETEIRKVLVGTRRIPNLIGVVAFVNFTTASNLNNNVRLMEYINPAGGVGIDLMLLPKARTSIGLDYGIGNYGSDGFYIRLNKAF